MQRRLDVKMNVCLVLLVLVFAVEGGRPNVLFFLVDDLKPTIGGYGDGTAITPWMDKIIAEGVRFDNMHTQKSECAPSRASMLSGLRPDQNRVWGFDPVFRKSNPNLVTLPGLLRNNGYRVEAVGKIFDNRNFYKKSKSKKESAVKPGPDLCGDSPNRRRQSKRKKDKPCSFDGYVTMQDIQTNMGNICGNGIEFFPGSGEKNPYNRHAYLTYAYPDNLQSMDQDYCLTSVAIRLLQDMDANVPFALMIGFAKPHMPWSVPERIDALFRAMDDTKFIAPDDGENFWNDHSSSFSFYDSQELKQYQGWRTVSDADRTRAYYGSVTFVDEQIGRIMTTLEERTELFENTIVVLWGDHGFHTGDHDLWGKKTIFEQATRLPFAISLPPQHPLHDSISKGGFVEAPTDSVDIYPTLAELCNISMGSNGKKNEFSGVSLAPLLTNTKGYVRAAAISQYPSYGRGNYIGYSIRTQYHRMIIYAKRDRKANNLKRPLAYNPRDILKSRIELYRYNDQGDVETVNQFGNPEFAHAQTMLMEIFTENKDRGFRGLMGEKPFDFDE